MGRVQERLTEDVGVDVFDAALVFNIAPLPLRCDIAILSLIHRTMLGQGPQHLPQWFFRGNFDNRMTLRVKRRSLRLHKCIDGRQLVVLKRFASGLISISNVLPTAIVEAKTCQMLPAAVSYDGKHRMFKRSAFCNVLVYKSFAQHVMNCSPGERV